jgi:hypothetical protein
MLPKAIYTLKVKLCQAKSIQSAGCAACGMPSPEMPGRTGTKYPNHIQQRGCGHF